MQVGVTGSREGINGHQDINLSLWITDHTIDTFRHGDCVGADVDVAASISVSYPKCKIVCHPPEKSVLRGYFESDEYWPEKSYFARNRDIVDNSDILLGFPSHYNKTSGGTWYTINYATRNNVETFIFYPDGKVGHFNGS